MNMSEPIDFASFADICAPAPPAEFIGLLTESGFSPQAYLAHYADLTAAKFSDTMALRHFFEHGLRERRTVPMTIGQRALLDLVRLPMHDAAFKAELSGYLCGQLFAGVDHPFGPAIADRWSTIQVLRQFGARPFFIAGDSHSNQFRQAARRDGTWLLPIHLLCTGGSAAGLANPASRSSYGAHLRQAVQTIQSLAGAGVLPFLLQFGQVDIEFVHHFQRVRDKEPTLDLDAYAAFCDRTADRYVAFVADMFAPVSRRSVSIVSICPPVVSDAAWQAGYENGDVVRRETDLSPHDLSAGIRGLQIANLRQRTDIHARFNARLRVACEQHGFGYVDSFTPFLGQDGLTDPRYISPDMGGADHHLDLRTVTGAVETLIWQCIDAAAPQKRPV
jgi:hypothetical protein